MTATVVIKLLLVVVLLRKTKNYTRKLRYFQCHNILRECQKKALIYCLENMRLKEIFNLINQINERLINFYAKNKSILLKVVPKQKVEV